MNQKGEATLFSILCLVALTGLMLLTSLELKKEFSLLKKRTDLFLCVKETKGELKEFITFMGRTNWGIKNINRASLIMIFIPGFQGAALDAQKLKKALIHWQNLSIAKYAKTVHSLKAKSCPVDPRMYLTPFEMTGTGFKRDKDGAAILRRNTWDYHFLSRPYFLSLRFEAKDFEAISPRFKITALESAEKLSSLLSSR